MHALGAGATIKLLSTHDALYVSTNNATCERASKCVERMYEFGARRCTRTPHSIIRKFHRVQPEVRGPTQSAHTHGQGRELRLLPSLISAGKAHKERVAMTGGASDASRINRQGRSRRWKFLPVLSLVRFVAIRVVPSASIGYRAGSMGSNRRSGIQGQADPVCIWKRRDVGGGGGN